ncbi:MAG TPA: hypothetical protein VMW65_15385, partial [Chloroflexota bacterium]|nr:hypothetical protein [Chloroflexota bacterium]
LDPDLLEITGMGSEQWNDLRGELEQVGLLTQDVILNGMKARFLHFHPVLTPYLRSLPGANDPSLVERYVRYYTGLTTHMLRMDKAQPERVRAIVQLSLPNLIRALDLLLTSDDVEVITATADAIITFLEYAGRLRERNALRARVLAAIRDKIAAEAGPLNWSTYWREKSLGEAELEKGDWTAALRRFQTLLFAIKGRPNDDELGPDSLAHAVTLQQLSRALHTGGRVPEAIDRWQAAWSIAELLRTASPADSDLRRLQGSLQCDHGDLLRDQGQYAEAKAAYDEALQIARGDRRSRGQARRSRRIPPPRARGIRGIPRPSRRSRSPLRGVYRQRSGGGKRRRASSSKSRAGPASARGRCPARPGCRRGPSGLGGRARLAGFVRRSQRDQCLDRAAGARIAASVMI